MIERMMNFYMKKNLIYNMIYQILIIIIPFITIPYVSRVIGSDGVGIYSYTYSIVYYFMLFCLLGINNYGNREIAKSSSNKKELSRKFYEIYAIQVLCSIIMILLYVIYICFFSGEYRLISLIEILYLFSALFDINWLFFGLEKFKITISRNIIIKIITVIMIFIFVKNKSDVGVYVSILALGQLLSQLILWIFLHKEIAFVKVDIKEIKKHFKPILLLFIPVIAVSIYKIMDKTMIGWFSTINDVGFYEQAEKILNFPLAIVGAIGTVMMPRMSNLVIQNEDKKIKKYIQTTLELTLFVAFPIILGIICISDNFIELYLGTEFMQSSRILKLLSVSIIFTIIANIIRTQYLIPYEKDKIYIISVIIGAFVNLIMNLIFIPLYKSIGACIGTVSAEFFVMLYQSHAVKDEIKVMKKTKKSLIFLFKSIIMGLSIYWLNYININIFLKILIQIIIGIIVYSILNINYIIRISKDNNILSFKKNKSKI